MFEQYRQTVRPALKSKLEEFALYGYDKVSENELWEFLNKKTWKRANEDRLLSQIVNDIMSVKVGDYMNFATVEAFKSPNFFNDEGMKALDKLI